MTLFLSGVLETTSPDINQDAPKGDLCHDSVEPILLTQHNCNTHAGNLFPTGLHTMANDLSSARNARFARKTLDVAAKRISAA